MTLQLWNVVHAYPDRHILYTVTVTASSRFGHGHGISVMNFTKEGGNYLTIMYS